MGNGELDGFLGWLLMLVCIVPFCTVVACLLGGMRGHPWTGALLGLFAGPLGLVLALLLPWHPKAWVEWELCVGEYRQKLGGKQPAALARPAGPGPKDAEYLEFLAWRASQHNE